MSLQPLIRLEQPEWLFREGLRAGKLRLIPLDRNQIAGAYSGPRTATRTYTNGRLGDNRVDPEPAHLRQAAAHTEAGRSPASAAVAPFAKDRMRPYWEQHLGSLA